MTNPIMQALNANNRITQNNNNLFSRLTEIKQLLGGQAPEVVYNRLMQSNPKFAQFVQQNQGKSLEQLSSEFGIDMQLLQSFFK